MIRNPPENKSIANLESSLAAAKMEALRLRTDLGLMNCKLMSALQSLAEATENLSAIDHLLNGLPHQALEAPVEPQTTDAMREQSRRREEALAVCKRYIAIWRFSTLHFAGHKPWSEGETTIDGAQNPVFDIISSGLFDPIYYKTQANEVGDQLTAMVEHYLRSGALAGLDPNPLFQSNWYLSEYQDVARSKTNPLLHFIWHGESEGRRPNILFDPKWYLSKNPDVEASGVSPLRHYFEFGCIEGRDPHPLFANNWYWSQQAAYSDLLPNPLAHYIRVGAAAGREPHPLFQTAWYFGDEAQERRARENPLQHYMEQGAKQRLSPHPFFDAKWYLYNNPDVQDNPLVHYLYHGGFEGRDPNPEFSSKRHLDKKTAGNSTMNPLLAFVLSIPSRT